MHTPSRNIRVVCLVIGLVAAFASIAPTANAADGDGIVQPGDRFGGDRYCTAGPTFEQFVFSPRHCAPIGSIDLYDTGPTDEPLHDYRIGVSPSSASTITTWTDCPSVRQSYDEPVVVGHCATNTADLDIAGIIQPWEGMAVYKSGSTSGTSRGIVDSLIPNWPIAVKGLYVCRGDSGSPLYTIIDGRNYLVGMVNWGDGSVDLTQPGYQNGPLKACYQPSDSPSLVGDALTMGQLCPHLPADAATRCATEAGSPRGGILDTVIGPDYLEVRGFAFDPDTAGYAEISSLSFAIDGVVRDDMIVTRTPFARAAEFQLNPNIRWGFQAIIPRERLRSIEVCVDVGNEGGTPGTSKRIGCTTASGAEIPSDPGAAPSPEPRSGGDDPPVVEAPVAPSVEAVAPEEQAVTAEPTVVEPVEDVLNTGLGPLLIELLRAGSRSGQIA